ncbi:MAG: aldehyde ferredoxin oxidoreductase C-terminal domain-containing protein, partial [Bacillota bacterium]
LREGEKKEDSVFPQRFYKEGNMLNYAKVQEILEDYYQYRGWYRETGIPTKEKLQQLGLTEYS